MKILNKIHVMTILTAGLLVLSGCKDEKKSDYIKLSSNSFTFDPQGEDVFEITVDASKSWNVEIADDWVLQQEKEETRLVLGVEPSKSNSIRTTKLKFTAGEATETVTVSQLGTNVSFAMMDNNIITAVISPNGNYLAGVGVKIVDNVYQYTPFTISATTGQKASKETITKDALASAVADNGFLVLSGETGLDSQYYDANGTLQKFPVPPGFDQAVVEATSADGRICVGYARNSGDAKYYALKWTDFVYEILDMPTETLLGQSVEQGAMARGCSADGSVVYGSVWDDFSAVYWKDGKVDYVSRDKIWIHDIVLNTDGRDVTWKVVDRPRIFADKYRMSPNGKYLGLAFARTTAQNKSEKIISFPAVFNTETAETFILTDIPAGFEDGGALTVSDNGLLSFGCPATGSTSGFVYNMQTGKTLSAIQFISQEYGFSISSDETLVNCITNGGKTVLGSIILAGGSATQFWYLNILE